MNLIPPSDHISKKYLKNCPKIIQELTSKVYFGLFFASIFSKYDQRGVSNSSD
jgi:hypothetical protein